MPSDRSSGKPFGFTGLLIAIVLIGVTACGAPDSVSSQPGVTDGSSFASTTAIETTTTTSEGPTTLNLDEGLPRTASYSFIDVTITEAALGHIDPRSYLTDEWEAADEPFLFLHLTIHNNSNVDVANWPPNPFSIVVGGQTSGPPQVLEGRPNIGLTALQTTSMTLGFRLEADPQFEDISLVVAESGRIPMILPLVGEVPDYGYPIVAGVEATGHIQGGCGQDVEVTTLGAVTGIDLLNTPYPTTYGSRRAKPGERFLTVSLHAHNHGGQHCGGGSTNFGANNVRLVIDDDVFAPVAGVNQTIPANSVIETDIHFVFPIEAKELTLIIGDESELHLSVPVDVSEAAALTVED